MRLLSEREMICTKNRWDLMRDAVCCYKYLPHHYIRLLSVFFLSSRTEPLIFQPFFKTMLTKPVEVLQLFNYLNN